MKRKVADISSDLKGKVKPPTDVYESIGNVFPAQPGNFTVTNAQQKIQFYIPNTGNLRLSQMFLSGTFTANYTSTNGADTFAVTQPAFVPYFSSLINRWTLWAGSSVVIDQYNNNLRYNLQQNLRTNTLLALAETNNNPTGAFVGGTVATGQYGRFQLNQWDDEIFSAAKGFLPVGIMPKLVLDLYFDVPNRVMWYGGTVAGTITLNYSVANLQLELDYVSSQFIKLQLAQRSLNVLHKQWFWVQIPIAANTLTINEQIPCNFRFVDKVVGVITKVADETSLTSRDKLKVYSSELNPLTRFNARINSLYRFQEPLQGGQILAELRRSFPIAEYASFFSSPTTSQTTNSVYCATVGNSYSKDMESGFNSTSANNQIYIEMTFTTALASASNLHVFILHDRWLNIGSDGGLFVDE